MARGTAVQEETSVTESVPSDPPAESLTELEDIFAGLENPVEVETALSREIPERVKKFVDRGYELFQSKPRKWWGVDLKSKKAVGEVRRDAKVYAASRGLVFRVKTTTDPNMLVYRVMPAPPVRETTPETAPDENPPETAGELCRRSLPSSSGRVKPPRGTSKDWPTKPVLTTC